VVARAHRRRGTKALRLSPLRSDTD
jgi:hypothetical protein